MRLNASEGFLENQDGGSRIGFPEKLDGGSRIGFPEKLDGGSRSRDRGLGFLEIWMEARGAGIEDWVSWKIG